MRAVRENVRSRRQSGTAQSRPLASMENIYYIIYNVTGYIRYIIGQFCSQIGQVKVEPTDHVKADMTLDFFFTETLLSG